MNVYEQKPNLQTPRLVLLLLYLKEICAFVLLTHIICYCTFMEKNIIENKRFYLQKPQHILQTPYKVYHSVRHPACFLMNHPKSFQRTCPWILGGNQVYCVFIITSLFALCLCNFKQNSCHLLSQFLPLYLNFLPFFSVRVVVKFLCF